MNGTGNDFLIVDIRDAVLNAEIIGLIKKIGRNHLAKALCDRHRGIGADGLLFLESDTSVSKVHFKWDFFNADGSHAEMCGNAARCVGRYAHERCGYGNPIRFNTVAGIIETQVHEDQSVAVTMSPITSGQSLLQKMSLRWLSVNSGVPHFVIHLESPPELENWQKQAAEIRHHKDFQPAGTNVTLVWPVDNNTVGSASFERGVEDFTLACGTGAVAAAFAFSQWNPAAPTKVFVRVPGGELAVDLSGPTPILSGQAAFVADCNVSSEFLAAIGGTA